MQLKVQTEFQKVESYYPSAQDQNRNKRFCVSSGLSRFFFTSLNVLLYPKPKYIQFKII